MSDKQPVFVCGLARSGTGWISRSLGQSDELEYIGESWMISKLEDLTAWCNRILSEFRFNSFAWNKYSDDKNYFVRSIGRFYKELLYEASQGKRFIEKTPNWNIEYLELLNEFFPDAFYILIYRDGRNQVASYEQFTLNRNNNFDFTESCEKWSLCMDKIHSVKTSSLLKHYMIIRYEDLLINFNSMFNDMCDFVEINCFHPKVPIINSSFKGHADKEKFDCRWHGWTDEKKTVFKKTAGKQLIAWGYVDSDDSW